MSIFFVGISSSLSQTLATSLNYLAQSFDSAEACLAKSQADLNQAKVFVINQSLPDTSGLELVQKIRTYPFLEEIPVILCLPESSLNLIHDLPGQIYVMLEPLHVQALQNNITALLRSQYQIQELKHALASAAGIDPLTELSKRENFESTLDREWRRALREQQYLSLLLIDLDYFIRINETHGHEAGDACLKAVGSVLKNYPIRPGDLTSRHSGELFTVILPNTHVEGARAVGETIRQNIEQLEIPFQDQTLKITASVGGACLYIQDDTLEPSILFHAADKALEQAKAVGRNVVSISDLTESLLEAENS